MKTNELAEYITEIGVSCSAIKLKGTYYNEQMIDDLYDYGDVGLMYKSTTGVSKYIGIVKELELELQRALDYVKVVAVELNKLEME